MNNEDDDLTGKFDNIKGLIIGDMSDIKPENDFYKDVNEIILEIFENKNIPIVSNFPIGHYGKNIIIPLNSVIKIDTYSGKYDF